MIKTERLKEDHGSKNWIFMDEVHKNGVDGDEKYYEIVVNEYFESHKPGEVHLFDKFPSRTVARFKHKTKFMADLSYERFRLSL